ncbi:MAG TPA: Smr/MutS family protein [Rudaea sp.]|nr:Smr/MutS family protein [Rudaea sp.]
MSEEDRQLFAEAVGPVRTIRSLHHEIPRARPAPEATQALLDEARVVDELMSSVIDPALIEIGEELSYLKDGVAPRVLRNLKRGHYSIGDEIDLHQMTEAVARAAIKQFLEESLREDKLCVKIIHGKGLRSRAAGPVLKRMVDSVLRRRADVIAFASAKAAEGGTGATVVLLKHRQKNQ